jgi:hypothetical protein
MAGSSRFSSIPMDVRGFKTAGLRVLRKRPGPGPATTMSMEEPEDPATGPGRREQQRPDRSAGQVPGDGGTPTRE